MNQLFSVCIISCLLQLISSSANGISLQSMNSWISGGQQESGYEEHHFKPLGTLNVHNETVGSIVIKTWARPMLVIKSVKHIKEKKPKPALHISVDEKQASITIDKPTDDGISIDLELMIPEQTTVSITARGPVKIKSIDGSIYVKTQDTIDVRHIGNSITAISESSCSISFHTIPLKSNISITAKDQIELALPPETNAILNAKAEHGSINCQLFFTFKPFCTKLNKNTWNQMRKEINGYLGNAQNLSEEKYTESALAKIDVCSKNKSINIVNSRD
ncbi:hypothetical protein HYX58_03440 [Candidatus Dependentiae bacterium]|nr:hypothetical protein [Candidatus Dependentiae bacterium]